MAVGPVIHHCLNTKKPLTPSYPQADIRVGLGYRASQVVLMVKNLTAKAGDVEIWVRSLGREDPLEKDVATHSSILA